MPLRSAPVPRHPVRRVEAGADHGLDPAAYPASIPAVRQVLDDGLDLGPGVTFLVGENGSGKSTLVEAVATAFGLSPEGGSSGSRHSTRSTESPLGDALHLVRGVGSSRWGFFLRAETMHGWYSYLEPLGGVHLCARGAGDLVQGTTPRPARTPSPSPASSR